MNEKPQVNPYSGKTHFITISKEQFDEIEIGDRLIIQNDKNYLCYAIYVNDTGNRITKRDIEEMNELIRKSRNKI